MRTTTVIGVGLAVAGAVCFVVAVWMAKESGPLIGGPSKTPLLLLFLAVALLYGGIRWLSFGVLRRLAT